MISFFSSEKPQRKKTKRSRQHATPNVSIPTIEPHGTALETEIMVERFGPVTGMIIGRKKIRLGGQVTIAGTGCQFLATEIVGIQSQAMSCTVTGPVINENGDAITAATVSCNVPDVDININYSELLVSSHKLLINAAEKKALDALKTSTWKERFLIRKQQLALYVREEVLIALKTSAHATRHSSLGPLVIDMDLEILGCTCRMPSVFNYIKRNIQNLDQFLGNKWDILEMEEEFYKFISNISFKIDKAGVGKVSISTSRGEGVLQGDYRGTIQERINLYGM
jgi:hypothetical protein